MHHTSGTWCIPYPHTISPNFISSEFMCHNFANLAIGAIDLSLNVLLRWIFNDLSPCIIVISAKTCGSWDEYSE